jgi:hypothetical protein
VELCVCVNAAAAGGAIVSWPPVLGLFKAVVVTLTYLRRNRAQAEIGAAFGVSQPTISRAITGLTAVLGLVLRTSYRSRRTSTLGASTSWTGPCFRAGHGTVSGSCTRASTRRRG